MNVHNHDGQVYTAEGAPAYLRTSGIMCTFISGIILRREDFEQIEKPFRYIDLSLNQAYMQYEILTRNPSFCVVNRRMFNFSGNPPSGYNLGEVVFRSYQTILRHFIGKGLSEVDVQQEKLASLYNYILLGTQESCVITPLFLPMTLRTSLENFMEKSPISKMSCCELQV